MAGVKLPEREGEGHEGRGQEVDRVAEAELGVAPALVAEDAEADGDEGEGTPSANPGIEPTGGEPTTAITRGALFSHRAVPAVSKRRGGHSRLHSGNRRKAWYAFQGR